MMSINENSIVLEENPTQFKKRIREVQHRMCNANHKTPQRTLGGGFIA